MFVKQYNNDSICTKKDSNWRLVSSLDTRRVTSRIQKIIHWIIHWVNCILFLFHINAYHVEIELHRYKKTSKILHVDNIGYTFDYERTTLYRSLSITETKFEFHFRYFNLYWQKKYVYIVSSHWCKKLSTILLSPVEKTEIAI